MAISPPGSNVKILDASGMVVVKCFGILIEAQGEGGARTASPI